ncbi:MAG: aminotransferase, partial [Eubacterium sp.]|nr:aminotransferase [Eubacterium sp.]
QTISYDKMNQQRHVKFFGDANGVRNHMKKHAAILKPKFDMVLRHLDNELSGRGIASWVSPKGGYFISLDVLEGCAKRVGELCKEAGVTLTTVGATFPYGKDERDSNIRIAPSYPPVEELDLAAELLCICVRLASVEKYLAK